MTQDDTDKKQERATNYYNGLAKFYDYLSPKVYYHNARKLAIKELRLTEGMNVLNVPVGTGQNIEYFQSYLNDTGLIVGVDIAPGMLAKAKLKIKSCRWNNTELLKRDVLDIDSSLLANYQIKGFDAILCDLGLSGFPNWRKVIDTLILLLSPNGRISIMDWYIDKPSWRGSIVKLIGKGEVDRPIWQYLETKICNFSVDTSFNRGGVFVASGTKCA